MSLERLELVSHQNNGINFQAQSGVTFRFYVNYNLTDGLRPVEVI